MNAQKIILGGILGGITLFALGYVIYELILPRPEWSINEGADAVSRNFFPGIIIFELVFGIMIAYVYNKWANIKTFKTGLKEGAILGLFLGIVASLWMYSTTTLITEMGVLWWIITFAIRFAFAGGVIGWFLGRGPSKAG